MEKYNIVTSVTSRTLPTLIMFKDGREYMRRPLLDTRERVVPFSFSFVSQLANSLVNDIHLEPSTNSMSHLSLERYQENIVTVFNLGSI